MGTFKIKSDGYYNSELAQIVGLENAIFIQDIAYWLDYNKSSGSAFEDGRYWSYSTLSAICERHPYWTKRQVERIIKNCRENGWIIVSNFNKSKYDRTNWYSLGDKILEFIGVDKEGNQFHELENSISPNGEMSFPQTVTPIQDIYNKKNNNSNNPPFIPPEDFSREMKEVFSDWLEYKKEKNQSYKPTGIKMLISKIREHISKYGEQAVIAIIKESMSANYQGIVWDKLKSQEKQSYTKKMDDWKTPIPNYDDDLPDIFGR